MKLTFLGTGAGEGYPGFWCRCPHCAYARRQGGKNLRAYSAAALDDVLLLDCGPTAFPNAARFGLDLTQAHTLLITHPHEDHLLPLQLLWRAAEEANCGLPFEEKIYHGGARFTSVVPLAVYGNAHTEALLKGIWAEEIWRKNGMTFTRVHEGAAFESHGYRVTPVRGNHGKPGFAHSYIIEKEGRTLLYALDSGSFDEDQQALLRSHVYDAVVMEGTYGLNSAGDGHHMSLEKNIGWLRFFKENGCCAANFHFYLTHMSPHWCPPHDQYAEMAREHGLEVAWDGMTVEV